MITENEELRAENEKLSAYVVELLDHRNRVCEDNAKLEAGLKEAEEEKCKLKLRISFLEGQVEAYKYCASARRQS